MTDGYYSDVAEKKSETESIIADYRETKAYRHNTAEFIVKIMVVFAVALVALLRSASITEIGQKVNSTQKEYETLVKENRILTAEIAECNDVETLKKLAEEKFGMALPEEYQKVYIDSAEADHTELYNKNLTEDKETKEKSLSLSERIKRFFGFV